jgi:ABC-type antimicrobial peptide transport system permease subunit
MRISLWRFFINHSLRDLARNKSRSMFALFSIATGVAAVVALRSLGGMIGDELTLNLAEINRGDMQIVANDDISPLFYTTNTQNEVVFSELGVEALREWAADEDVDIQFASTRSLLQLLPLNDDGSYGAPVSSIPILVEPELWPFYGFVTSVEPQETLLIDLFPPGEPNIVISRRVALDAGLEIGDQVVVGGVDRPLTISAFVADETEGSLVLRNGPAGLIGFFYYPLAQAEDLGLTPLPERAYVRMELGRDVSALEESLEDRFGENVSDITTLELEEQNEDTAQLVNDLILVMGLSAILIGGIGIVNTMNVIVARRTLEIAVLKTLGLKAWRITVLFLVEAVLMGVIGSIIGVLIGIGLSYLVRGVGEEVLNTSLSWRAYPEAWYSGITLGVVVTVAFGFLPTLNAGQVRPAGVLRPNEITLPNAGLKRTLGALILTIVVFGLTLNSIVQGEIQLPISMMLGLGGFLVGIFGGIMLANEGIMKPIPADADERVTERGVIVLTAGIGSLLLVGLYAVHLLQMTLHPLVIFGTPIVTAAIVYLVVKAAVQRHADLGLKIARSARQLMLFGGALILGGMIGGGLFTIIGAVLAVLYPRDTSPPGLLEGGIISAVIGLLAFAIFRFRVRIASEFAGLALVAGSVLAVIGFGVGDALESAFGGLGAWESIERVSAGIIVVEIIVLTLGGSLALANGIVWLISKSPSAGNVDVKLSLRNLNARRGRTASTMIGLTVGIAALSLITLTTGGVTSLLRSTLETDVGGNVIILSRDPATGEAVRKRLENTIEGVNEFTQFTVYRGRIIAVNGAAPDIDGFELGDAADGNTREFGQSEREEGIGFAFTTVDPTQPNPPDYLLKQGELIGPEHVGQRVMIIREPFPGSLFDRLGVDLGSTVTWRLRPNDGTQDPVEITFTVIGIIDRDSDQAGVADSLQAPSGSVPDSIQPDSVFTVADIDEEYVDAAMIEFAQITNAFAIEIGFIVQLAERLLAQLIAIPALVAILALFAGIAIIANTVALDTQERRRQIGVMKTVGLKGHRVLGQLMFENGLVGLVAGLIGVGIGLVATILVGVLGNADQVGSTLQLMPAVRLIFMAVGVALAATLFAAWSAAREKPMNVLRYE